MRGHFASRDCYWGWGRNIIHDSAAKSVLPLSCLLSPETVSLQNAGHKLALTKVTIALNDSMEGKLFQIYHKLHGWGQLWRSSKTSITRYSGTLILQYYIGVHTAIP